MKNLRAVTVVVLCGLVSAVHAASPKPSGFLSDYDRLVEGEYLEAYWVEMPQVERRAGPRFSLGEISADKIKDHKGVTVSDCVGWLRNDLLGRAIFSAGQDARYRLDLAVTYMNPGSAAKRIWAGEFGAGHAKLQIEGKVVDTQSGEVIAAFAERRRSSGSLGAQDLKGDAGPHIIEHLVSLVSADIDSELRASFTSR